MIYQNTLVKFGATWCNPCHQAEIFLQKHYLGKYTSVDVVGSEDIAKAYQIKNVPTFILFDKQGVIRDRFVGFDPTKIAKAIETIS